MVKLNPTRGGKGGTVNIKAETLKASGLELCEEVIVLPGKPGELIIRRL